MGTPARDRSHFVPGHNRTGPKQKRKNFSCGKCGIAFVSKAGSATLSTDDVAAAATAPAAATTSAAATAPAAATAVAATAPAAVAPCNVLEFLLGEFHSRRRLRQRQVEELVGVFHDLDSDAGRHDQP